MLPVSGYLASQDRMSLTAAILAATLGSLAGALLLYGFGARLGAERLRAVVHKLPLIEVRDLDRAQGWFDRHGPSAVLIGRGIPVVRSLVSVPAGASRMSLLPFVIYTVIGSAVWNTALIAGGYALGSAWTDIGQYSDWINAAFWIALVAVVGRFVVRRLRRRPPPGATCADPDATPRASAGTSAPDHDGRRHARRWPPRPPPRGSD